MQSQIPSTDNLPKSTDSVETDHDLVQEHKRDQREQIGANVSTQSDDGSFETPERPEDSSVAEQAQAENKELKIAEAHRQLMEYSIKLHALLEQYSDVVQSQE